MKENNGKMKKIEASLLKRLLRISSWLFVSFSLELSLILAPSHNLGHLEFTWRILALDQGRKIRHEEAKIKDGKERSNSYEQIL